MAEKQGNHGISGSHYDGLEENTGAENASTSLMDVQDAGGLKWNNSKKSDNQDTQSQQKYRFSFIPF